MGQSTEIHFIVLETVAELGPVDHENPPILREMLLPDAETDGRGVEGVANDTVVDFLPLLVDPIEQPSIAFPASSSNPSVLIRPASAFATSAASLPFSSLSPSICFLQRLANIPRPPIASLIESTTSA